MTKRKPVSAIQNEWFDTQKVDNSDLSVEQDYNDTIVSGIINNHIGSGILPEVLEQNILFNSSNVSGYLDGKAIYAQSQPTDSNFGNQLEVSITNSTAASRRAVKLCIIGLDFENNLQYEIFYFRKNETQISKKHFTNILLLLFNDFVGDPDYSMNLGGTLLIKEANPMSLSRDAVMVSQSVEPNLFFRDFYLESASSVNDLLTTALPTYNVSNLEISTEENDNKVLLKGDVTTQIGQKFQATTNNIQKITLLLSVRNLDDEDDLEWNGDVVVSIFPLQTDVSCSTDFAPSDEIDFQPNNIPVGQIGFDFATLQARGIVLDSVPQPVDFIFSNTPVAGGNVIIPGQYYAITISRSGSANKTDILVASGLNRTDNSRLTTFTGLIWVDSSEEDLWFQVWHDAAKVSSGQAYDTGHGISIEKTILNAQTQSTIDNIFNNIQFTGNDVYRAMVAAITEKSDPIIDESTGNPVLSKKQYAPEITLLNSIAIANLEEASEPLLIGAITDKNRKFFDPLSTTINAHIRSATIVDNEILIKIITDQTDTGRYDESVKELATNLLNGDFVGAKVYPNATNSSIYYRVAEAKLCSMVLGDVDGDGFVTDDDLTLLNTYLNFNMNAGLPASATVSRDGYVGDDYTEVSFTNGYSTYSQAFSDLFPVKFYIVDTSDDSVIESGDDGVLVADPNDSRIAQLTSVSVDFSSITDIANYKLVIYSPSVSSNHGGYDITAIDTDTDVLTIRKIILNGDTMAQMLRADINGDFAITDADGYLLNSYLDRENIPTNPSSPYAAPTSNAYSNIGVRFNVLRLKLETFIDRKDDYTNLGSGRGTGIHPLPDIFEADGYFASLDFYNNPAPITFEKQLTWDESLIVSNSQAKLVPAVFTSNNGDTTYSCNVDGVSCSRYDSAPEFDKGNVNLYVPDNIILGKQITTPSGDYYKVDFEIGTIVLEVPDSLFGSERTINVLEDFIADYNGNGVTKLGFPAMRFADCSYVGTDGLTNDQVRFSVSVQSFSPQINGLSEDGYEGAILDGKMGVSVDYNTGLITLNFSNLYQDETLKTLSTKIQINVYLKKGSFNNTPLFVDSTKVQNMLELISIFGGENLGGPSALIDLTSDVSDVLPILNGGTGLNAVGISGTVLTSNGSGLSYEYMYDGYGVISYSSGISDANRMPKTDGYGLLDPSFYYKNPVYIYGVAGTFTNNNITPTVIGAMPFRFDKFIMANLSSIKLEVILETTDATNAARIKLYDVENNSYLTIDGVTDYVSTTSNQATVIQTDDLKNLFNEGSQDFVYEIHLQLTSTDAAENAICKMARLVIEYDNPSVAPPTAHTYNFVDFLPPTFDPS